MKSTTGSRWVGALLLAGTLAVPAVAAADMERSGTWPQEDRKVSLELERTPLRVALRHLAEKAGWSIVVPSGLEELVDVQVKEQRADRVLEMLLLQDRYVAHRSGDLLQVRLAVASVAGSAGLLPALPAPPAPPAPPSPFVLPVPPPIPGGSIPESSKDRTVMGGSAKVGRGEVVGHLTVMGGSVEVEGEVQGDLTVVGGSAVVKDSAVVQGEIRAIGGLVQVEEGARLRVSPKALGGVILQGQKAKEERPDERPSRGLKLQNAAKQAGSSLSSAAMLFVFGSVLWSLLTGRMERLQGEVASRPMRTFAVGFVGALVSSILAVALCVTLIGIPVALVGVIGALLAAYAGLCALLQTAGKALIAHRTSNPYLHLALGCLLLFIAGNLPWIGAHMLFAAGLVGFGAALATGLGGITRPLLGTPEDRGPYRSVA